MLSILTEAQAPVKTAAILDAAKARKPDVMAAIKGLVTAKRIVRQGASRATTYALPKFANVIVADTD